MNQPLESPAMLIGEGSTFLVLEEREHARQRGVPILAEIRSWGQGTDPTPLLGQSKQPGKGLTRIIHKSLERADIPPSAIDVVFLAGPSFEQEDRLEEMVINDVFGRPSTRVTSKTVLGHLQGAAVATDVALATLALQQKPILSTQDSSSHSLSSLLQKDGDISVEHALVLSNGLGGTHANLIISKSA